MNIVEAMERRHAVRDFSDRPIDDDTLRALNEAVDAANADGGLDVQLVQDDTDAFGGCPTHYGRFKNVRYCIALIGSDDEDPAQLDRKVGYYGERLALTATQLGMGSSWVVLHETHDHDGRWRLGEGERMPAAPLTLDVHYSQAAKLGDVIYPHLHEQDGALTVTLDNADGKHYAIVSVS